MNLTAPIKRAIGHAALGIARATMGAGTFIQKGSSGISIPWPGAPLNWWQIATDNPRGNAEKCGPVYTCVKIISEDMSRIPIVHNRFTDDKKFEVVKNKAPYRVFRKPNPYQTKSDWVLYFLRSLLLDGNSYNYIMRNNRTEIEYLYPLNPKYCWPYIEPESGEIYYRVTRHPNTELIGLEGFGEGMWIPPRDIFHTRMETPNHPLIGESPLFSIVYPIVANMEINKHTAEFFKNMGRPSGLLRHPGDLSVSAMKRIKEGFVNIFKNGNTGEPIVLREGMEWTPLTMSAVDAEVVGSYELTERQISQAYRVPNFLLGEQEKSTNLANVESLLRFYVQSCLGFYVDHVEDALNRLFALPDNEHIEFNLDLALLRGDFEQRMNAYAKGIQNAVLAPDEAREREKLHPVEYGDQPRVQQQLVPLSYGANLQPPQATPAAPAEPEPEPDDGNKNIVTLALPTPEDQEADVISAYNALKRVINE